MLQSGEFLANICFSFQQWRPLISDAQNKQHGHQRKKSQPLTSPSNLCRHHCSGVVLWDGSLVRFRSENMYQASCKDLSSPVQLDQRQYLITCAQQIQKVVEKHLILNSLHMLLFIFIKKVKSHTELISALN